MFLIELPRATRSVTAAPINVVVIDDAADFVFGLALNAFQSADRTRVRQNRTETFVRFLWPRLFCLGLSGFQNDCFGFCIYTDTSLRRESCFVYITQASLRFWFD